MGPLHSFIHSAMQRFVSIRALGAGAYGSVVLAWDIERDHFVAIKRGDIAAEADLLSQISMHPNIVILLDVLTQGPGALVYEFMPATLEAILDQMPIPSPWQVCRHLARAVIFQVLCGLAHAHESGFVHRDVKPANILVDGPKVKLTDFGLGHRMDAPESCDVRGTVGYLAPELIMGAPPFTGAVDVWAVGMVMMDILSKAGLGGAPALLEDTEVHELLMRMLDPWPDKRISAGEAMRHPFFNGLLPWSGSSTSCLTSGMCAPKAGVCF